MASVFMVKSIYVWCLLAYVTCAIIAYKFYVTVSKFCDRITFANMILLRYVSLSTRGLSVLNLYMYSMRERIRPQRFNTKC